MLGGASNQILGTHPVLSYIRLLIVLISLLAPLTYNNTGASCRSVPVVYIYYTVCGIEPQWFAFANTEVSFSTIFHIYTFTYSYYLAL